MVAITPANILDLEKSFVLNLEKNSFPTIPPLVTGILVDTSKSMEEEIRSGWVDETLKKFLVVAKKFDNDGCLQVSGFNTCSKAFPNLKEWGGTGLRWYTDTYGMVARGGTRFAGPLFDMIKVLQGTSGVLGSILGLFKKQDDFKPSYIAMITDGSPDDGHEFEQVLAGYAGKPVFVQLIAIGLQVNEAYLRKVTQQYPNVGLIYMANPSLITDEFFYDLVCNDKFKSFVEKLNK